MMASFPIIISQLKNPVQDFWASDDGDADLERIIEDFPSSEEGGGSA
jgi:hypothetical protein